MQMFSTLGELKEFLDKPKKQKLNEQESQKFKEKREQVQQGFEAHGLTNSPNAYIVDKTIDFLAGTYAGTKPKGLLYGGNSGTGKTIMAYATLAYLNDQRPRCKFLTADDFVKTYLSLKDPTRWSREWRDHEYLIIDDFGRENTVSNYSAGKVEALSDLIIQRHDEFIKNGKITIITTNLDSAMIKERYGDRILSRLLEMCEPFKAKGQDLRKPVKEVKQCNS